MLEGFAFALAYIGSIAAIAILFGLVVLRVVGALAVDQSISAGEAIGLILGLLTLMGLTIWAWGSWLMVLPPLLGLAAAIGWRVMLVRQDRATAQRFSADDEQQARRLLERDPNAVVGYERLAEALANDPTRRRELLEVLEQWLERAPNARHVARRMDTLRADIEEEERLRAEREAARQAAQAARQQQAKPRVRRGGR